MTPRRVAVLVDGDNISAAHADRILAEAARLGRVDVSRAYAAADRPSGWMSAPGYRLVNAGSGKNAADVLLCIDAMELALLGGLTAFAIATSDGDFTHLAQRLRERGLAVLGLGEDKAPPMFRAACTDFTRLVGAPAPRPPVGAHSDLDRKIRALIAAHSRNGSGMRVAELGSRMHSDHGFRIGEHPERSWRAYLSNRPMLYELEAEGPSAMVRFRPEGFGPV